MLAKVSAVLLVLGTVASAAASGKERYYCSKLKPMTNLNLTESVNSDTMGPRLLQFLGSWVRLEMMLFKFGSPDFPAYDFAPGCCLRSDFRTVSDSNIAGSDSYFHANGSLYAGDAGWSVAFNDSKVGHWKYSAHEPYPLDMEIVVLQAQPSSFYVFATCMTLPQVTALLDAQADPDDLDPDDLLLVGLNVAVRRHSPPLTPEGLARVRDDLKRTLGLQKYNPWHWGTAC